MKPIKKSIALMLSIAILSMSFNSVHAARVSNEHVISQTQQLDARTQLVNIINRADAEDALGFGRSDFSRESLMFATKVAPALN